MRKNASSFGFLVLCVISYSVFCSGAFRLYDVDNDGFITRDEMYNIVEAIYQMVVRIIHFFCHILLR